MHFGQTFVRVIESPTSRMKKKKIQGQNRRWTRRKKKKKIMSMKKNLATTTSSMEKKTMNVAASTQEGGGQGKKDSHAYNDVIEETASKLLEKRNKIAIWICDLFNFMDKHIMDLSNSQINKGFIDPMNPQEDHIDSDKQEVIVPNNDFQPIYPTATLQQSNLNLYGVGETRVWNSSSSKT
ncbi:L-tryptophan--pyruvate aminotransferase [Sarracenia purpurea var. burkii]